MKLNKYIIGGFISLVALISMNSCSSDFLDEEYKSGYLTNYFDTEQGLYDLSTSLYANIRFWYGFESSYSTTQYGTDEFEVGTDNSNECWNTYNASFGPAVITINGNTTPMFEIWNQMYYGIASANTVITKADIISDPTKHDMALGEAHFLRGYNYYRLCAQYGSIVLKTTPSEGIERYFERSSAEDCLEQVIADLEKAYSLLPDRSITSLRGKLGWTKYTAAHFLAKALLLRVSERNDDWNSAYKSADLTRIITLCDDIIANRQLATDFRDLWNWTGVDCASETLDEILMAAQFNDDSSTSGRFNNQVHRYFNCQFHNAVFGAYIQRGVWIGHNYQRCRPSEYNIAVYDKENDSRFWKSTRTVYNSNLSPTPPTPPAKPPKTIMNPTTGVQYKLSVGDPVIIFICNGKISADGSSIDYHWDNSWDNVNFGMAGSSDFSYNGKDVPTALVHYNKKTNGAWRMYVDSITVMNVPKNAYVGLSKFEDGSRTGESAFGRRDGVLARVAETYLIKAEALVRQNKYQDAIAVVNILRDRAAFKSGENRTIHTDGTQAFEKNALYTANSARYSAYSKVNSYVLSTGVNSTDATSLAVSSPSSLPKEDEYVLKQLNVTSDYDRMLNFIMNERTRELNGEFVRWEDLSRTKLLITRAMAFNKECATAGVIAERHLLRPIPQTFIDGLVNNDGSPLTDDQKRALQNPGY